jgi:hypothetical protein
VLSQFIAAGERTMGASMQPQVQKHDVATITVSDEIFQVEGFRVSLVPRSTSRPVLASAAEYHYQRAARDHWSVARWRQERFWPDYPDFDVEVLDNDGRVVHGRTLLSTVRATYEQGGPVSTEQPPNAARLRAASGVARRPTQSFSRSEDQAPAGQPASIAREVKPPARQELKSAPNDRDSMTAEVGEPSSSMHGSASGPPVARQRGSTMNEGKITNHAGFIWSVADLLRGDYKQSEYGKVVLPLTVLRRLDCVLEPTKAAVLARAERLRGQVENVEPVLCAVAHQSFYNISQLDFRRLLGDPVQVAGNLRA